MRFLLFVLLGICIFPSYTLSRPVSYPGGWTVMTRNNGERNWFHLHYSPTAKYSVGYKFEYWRNRDLSINALQINNLVKRWNMPDSQANIYIKSGIGLAYNHENGVDDKSNLGVFTGIAADWENRRFFTSYQNRYTEAVDIDRFFMQSARLGIAPYIGDYGDLHTWLMVELLHIPDNDDQFIITPLVRFFKDIHLVEVGISTEGDLLFNWIIRF